jgi:transketolase
VYVLLGDGECQEGQVWEAAMTAGHYRLDTLTALVDRNGLQAMGRTEERMSVEPLAAKWQAFGWRTFEIDGHDMGAICGALEEAAAVTGRPSAIIARTVKGRGVPFMEGQTGFHNAAITEEQLQEARQHLEAALASLED